MFSQCLLSCYFPPCFDQVLYCIPSGVQLLKFIMIGSQGHVTKNKPMAVPVLVEWKSTYNIFEGRQLFEGGDYLKYCSLEVTRGAHNPNLQVVITHASHVCSQHLSGLPLRMNGMHRTLFNPTPLDLLSLVIWSHMFDYLSLKLYGIDTE